MTSKSREHDGREHDTRSKQGRPSIKYTHVTTSNMDPELIPEGMRYLKVAKETNGVSLSRNVQEAVRKGYTPVPKSRHPELSMGDDILVKLGEKSGSSEFLTDREHIFMEIPVERYQELLSQEREATENQTQFVTTGQDNGMQDQAFKHVGGRLETTHSHNSQRRVFGQ